jgi:hypothetical protein
MSKEKCSIYTFLVQAHANNGKNYLGITKKLENHFLLGVEFGKNQNLGLSATSRLAASALFVVFVLSFVH